METKQVLLKAAGWLSTCLEATARLFTSPARDKLLLYSPLTSRKHHQCLVGRCADKICDRGERVSVSHNLSAESHRLVLQVVRGSQPRHPLLISSTCGNAKPEERFRSSGPSISAE